MSTSSRNSKQSPWIPIADDDRTAYIEGIEAGWFTETEALWPGQKFALALEVSERASGTVIWCANLTYVEMRDELITFILFLNEMSILFDSIVGIDEGILGEQGRSLLRKLGFPIHTRLPERPVR